MYIQSDRYDLKYERKLDPTKIVANTDTEPFPPAEFFGSGTFDARLSSQSSMVAASPNAVSGPISYFKFLNPVPRDTNQSSANWRMGFTPHKPQYNNLTGELTGWLKADTNFTQPLTEDRNGVQTNVTVLPETEYVYLDYHEYNQAISFRGLEQGEDWFARIHPFSQDFRIGQPKGSYSGICSELILEKNDPNTVPVIERTATDLSSINQNGGAGPNNWTSMTSNEASLYLSTSTYFLQAEAPIYNYAKDPTNGQIAIFNNNIFVKSVFLDTDGNGSYETEVFIRFAGPQRKWTNNPVGGESTDYYVIPIKLLKVSDGSLVNLPLDTASLDGTGSNLVSDGASGFTMGYNSVTMRAWFQDPNNSGRYDAPNSYSSGSGSVGVFEFDAFPLYPFMELYDNSELRGAEIHDINLLGDVSTYNPQWKVNKIGGVSTGTYEAGTNAQTGELDINGNGNITQTPGIPDDLVPPAFTQVNRLSSSQIDRQAESLLRPGSTMTTLYINDETQMFDLTDIFGFDRKVITPDIVNTEAVFITGRSLDGTNIDLTINITYVEQL